MRSLFLVSGLLVSACSIGGGEHVPTTVAPRPIEYSCTFQDKLASDIRTLPVGSTIRIVLDDYHRERIDLGALHKMPLPLQCKK